MQQEPSITSVRVIKRVLKIPIASLYRNLQKIQEKGTITHHYVTDQPEKVFYRITDEGISIIVQLNEILGGQRFLPYGNEISKSITSESA